MFSHEYVRNVAVAVCLSGLITLLSVASKRHISVKIIVIVQRSV